MCVPCRRAYNVEKERDRCIRRGIAPPVPRKPRGDEFEITEDAEPSTKAEEMTQRVTARQEAHAQKIADEFAPLGPDAIGHAFEGDEYFVRVANDPKAAKEHKQEYSKLMGQSANFLSALAKGDLSMFADADARKLALYRAALAEEELRYMGRRNARSETLHLAREALIQREWRDLAERYLAEKIVPAGFAKEPREANEQRALLLMLSDLHLGSDLEGRGNPLPFRAQEEARCLEYLLRNVLGYKTDHRLETALYVFLAGDIIEGTLGHDKRLRVPGAEQRMIFLQLFLPFVAHCAAAFVRVVFVCVPGNHGRDTARHEGRALVDRWDGIESSLYEQLQISSRHLPNVSWVIPPRGIAAPRILGHQLLVFHGDVEPLMQNPMTKSSANAATLAACNNNPYYENLVFEGAFYGHWHAGSQFLTDPVMQFANGALLPASEFSRHIGAVNSRRGQWMVEVTKDHFPGDQRFIHITSTIDKDETLGKDLIRPWRYPRDASGLYSGESIRC